MNTRHDDVSFSLNLGDKHEDTFIKKIHIIFMVERVN